MKTMTPQIVAGLMVLAAPLSSLAVEPDVSTMTSEQRKAYFKEQIALKRIQDAHASAAASNQEPNKKGTLADVPPIGTNSSLNKAAPGGMLEQSPQTHVQKMAIYGRVLQTMQEGILVDCRPSGRIGLKQATGTVFIRGEFETEGGLYRSTSAVESGFLDYTTVLGAPKRVRAYTVQK